MEPLEKRKIAVQEHGKSVEYPALSPKWVENKKFLHYCPPSSEGIDIREWCDMMTSFKNDIHWLLKLPHHKFWSQAVFDKSLHTSLVSFLQEAPRFYSNEKIEDPSAKQLLEDVQKLVFLAFLRMSTHKESKDFFITPSTFGELLYENFIFDVPKLMDIAILYGPSNHNLLSKMFANIFSNQPNYQFDLEESAKSLVQVFQLLLGRLGLDESQAAGSSTNDLVEEELSEVITYLLDIAATIWHFLETYSPSSSSFISANIPLQLAELYEKAVPSLTRLVKSSKSSSEAKMQHNLNLARKFILKIYNSLLHSVTVKLLFAESQAADTHENFIETWLEWFTILVSERLRHFLIDYNLLFPIQDDVDLIGQMGAQIDPTRLEYVKGALKGFITEFGMSTTPVAVRSANGGVDSSKMRPLVSQVKELLPDLYDNFVEACLKHYDFNPEAVVNAILENNLAPHLIDMQIPDTPSIPEVKVPDGPVDISKKTRTKTVHFNEMRELLDDKQKDLKNVILDRVNEQIAAEYDDEYDDTYDSQAVGSEEPDAHNEEDIGRPFVTPRVLQSNVDDEVEEEEDGEPVKSVERPRDQFVANPAELRELAEQRRMNRRGYRRPGPTPAQRDVVGAPRGQGQDKDTIIARRHKTENKTRGANHNRRAMADRKRREF